MNEKKCLFIILPVTSHFNSVFAYAEALKKEGSNIFMASPASYYDYMKKAGFMPVPIIYFNHYFVTSWKVFISLFIASRFSKKFNINRLRNLLNAEMSAIKLITDLEPDVIYIDPHLSYYYLFILKIIKPWQRIVIINTKLATSRKPHIPPLYLGHQLINKKATYTPLAWSIHAIKIYFKKIISYFLYNGRDDDSLLKHLSKKRNIDFDSIFLSRYKTSFYLELNPAHLNTETIILAPRALEYPWYLPQKNENFINMAPYRFINKENKILETFLENIITRKSINSDTRLIYCSLGTLSAEYSQKIIPFFTRLTTLINEHPDYYLILATGDIDFKISYTQHNRLYIDKRLPQLKILKSCDLYITHGGLNSIRESIYCKVPMIIYPFNKTSDLCGNAARVHFNALGLKGNIRETSASITAKIKYIFSPAFQIPYQEKIARFEFTEKIQT